MNGDDDTGEGASTRTAMQVIVEISRDLLQSFNVKDWNEFVAELSRRELIPVVWSLGERPPPLGVMLDFRGLRRGHYHLTGIDLSLCWLDRACFEGACLKGAKMGCCPNADFRNARLQGASFYMCDISGCRFEGAELHDADFTDASYAMGHAPTGLPAETLAKCKAVMPEPPPAPRDPDNPPRSPERPLRATVTVSEVPW